MHPAKTSQTAMCKELYRYQDATSFRLKFHENYSLQA